jgi:hypothetical protein
LRNIPLLCEERWTHHQEEVPVPIWCGRGLSVGEPAGSKEVAQRRTEAIRPVGPTPTKVSSAKRRRAGLTTPSAPLRWLRGFFLLAQPPLLAEDGNIPLELQRLFAGLNGFEHALPF